jgi:hypothetical protein
MATGRATIGFIGSGEVAPKHTREMLKDHVESLDGNVRFIFPVTEKLFNDQLDVAVSYAMANDIPFEVVTDDSTDEIAKDVKDILAEAVKTHKVARVIPKLIGILADAPSPKLFILWDDDDKACLTAMERAEDEKIKSYDVCNSLALLEFDEDDEPKDSDGGTNDGERTSAPEEPADEPADDVEGDEPKTYTEAELDELEFDELKAIAKERGIEIKPRTRTPGYVKAILAHQEGKTISTETGEIEHVVPEEADQSEDGDEAQIPEEYEDDDAVEGSLAEMSDDEIAALDEQAERELRALFADQETAAPTSLVGECRGCGGPIFATGSTPEVTWSHAELCPLTAKGAEVIASYSKPATTA